MTAFTKSEENFIAHEVHLRVHDEKFKAHDEKFKAIEKRFDHLDNKLNIIIGIVISGVLLPVGLHFLKLI